MTFQEHLEQAIDGKETETHENRRRPTREIGHLLLSLEREQALRNLIREICDDGSDRYVE